MEQGRGLRSAGREWLNLILNSKIREGLTEKGIVEQSLEEMKRVRHKDIYKDILVQRPWGGRVFSMFHE